MWDGQLDGKKISVWECRWIPCENGLQKPFSQISVTNLKIKDLWNNDKTWNSSILSTIFNDPKDVEDISRIYIPKTELIDMRVRPFTKLDGSVSTKYAYKVLVCSNNANNNGKMNWKQFGSSFGNTVF